MSLSKSARQQSVPFLDLKEAHRDLIDEILAAWQASLMNAAFAGGPEVTGFESEFATFVGTTRAVGVSSGTDALRLALIALGIGRGAEVITVPHTFIATTEAITQAGATPVFVDVERHSGNIDPAQVEAAITPRTRAIVPVHLYGRPADMDPLLAIARRYDLDIVEDAAQAHGAVYKGRPVGTIGTIASFSFYPGKNLGACGEAGAVTTNDDDLADRVAMLRDHGQARKYHHTVEGWNGRLDAVQAAALRIKLRYLNEWNEGRRRCARRYQENLEGVGVELPELTSDLEQVFHLYVIRHANREELQQGLLEAGIHTGLHYPVPLHLQKAYQSMGFKRGAFPEAERWAERCLSLPMYPSLRDEQVDWVCDVIRDLVAGKADVLSEPLAR